MTRMRWIFALVISSLVLGPVAGASASPRLLAWWPMYEGQGQIVHDLSGNGNNGVLGSTTAVEASDPTWFHGGVLNSLHFSGAQFVTVPDSAALEPQAMTVLALARGSSSPGFWRYIVSKGALSCRTGSYGLYSGFGGGAAFYISDGYNVFVSPEAPPTVWDGKWHVFTGTFDGTTVRFFVDGTQIGTGTTVPLPFSIGYGLPTSDGAQVGNYVNNGCDLAFKGDIDEVSIWNAALPVTSIWQKVASLFVSGLH